MMRKRLFTSIAAAAFSVMGLPASADVLTPLTCPGVSCAGFTGIISVGETTFINNKVGVITAGTPTAAQADVLFISDTSVSMGSAVTAVRLVFGSVVTSLSGLANVATGAAQYKDRTNSPTDPFDYNLDQAITTNAAATQAAIAAWSASGGGDVAGQTLFALTQAAGNATGWRAGSKKIAVIVGVAPSHSGATAAGGATVGSTAAALVANGVTVESIDVSTNALINLNQTGQFAGALSIYSVGVDGNFLPQPRQFNGIVLSTLLQNAIGHAFTTYSDVSLNLISSSGPCGVALPSDIVGSFDRSVTRTFDFSPVGITGIGAGVCNFTIALEADGAILATEFDSVLVVGDPTLSPIVLPPVLAVSDPAASAVPEPTGLTVLALGIFALGFARRRFAN